MAESTKLQYIIELLTQGDTTRAAAELKKLEKSGGGLNTTLGSIKAGWLGVLAAFGGGLHIINESIDAFVEQERAVAKLNAALKSTGEFTPALSEEMQKLSETMAETSTFADEEILNVIAKLTALGAKKSDIERLTRATLDLATLMDGDLSQAARQMALALGGAGVQAFDRLRLNIDETLKPTEAFNAALLEIEKRAGGQSAEAVKTLGGQYEQLTKRVNEAKEALGGFVLSAGFNLMDFISGKGKKKADEDFAKIMGEQPGAAPLFLLSSKVPGAANPFRPPVSSPGLTEAERKKAQEDAIKAETELGRVQDQNFEDYQRGKKLEMDLANEAMLVSLDGVKRERAEVEVNHQTRLFNISQQRFATNEQYEDALSLEEALYQAELKRFQKQHDAAELLKMDLKEIEKVGVQAFAQGLSTAIVDAFEEGDKAFQKFAANFLKQIAQMILQALILRAIQSFGLGLAGGGQASALAGGGVRFAGSGIQELSSPTYFPKFNVVAGEAGRELMTVLARPRFERINGIPAQVGMAAGRRLAITSADALANAGGAGGAGGRIVIELRHTPETEARITENSVKGAVAQVTNDLHNDTNISRGVRKLAT